MTALRNTATDAAKGIAGINELLAQRLKPASDFIGQDPSATSRSSSSWIICSKAAATIADWDANTPALTFSVRKRWWRSVKLSVVLVIPPESKGLHK
ncbi:hypothetical protein [Paracoccus aestuarii]|uniref:hypothetical protein n=1 Tax=Paracoccus aestuarii TaxID=453842 RepID=UPI001476189C|nr:hypothetical protein [Paracoccus aestuarii]